MTRNDKDRDSAMVEILGGPIETHYFDDVRDEEYANEEHSEANKNLKNPSGQGQLEKARRFKTNYIGFWHDFYVRYGELCLSKINSESHLRKVSREVGCETSELRSILLGKRFLNERIYRRLNKALDIKPYELKQKRVILF